MKKSTKFLISCTVAASMVFGVFSSACAQQEVDSNYYTQICYDKIKYIDENLSDRDSIAGEQFIASQEWIKSELISGGYSESDISMPEITFSRYTSLSTLENAVAEYTINGYYKVENRKYVECEQEDATHANATFKSNNIVVTKKGTSEKQIIVGAHYDGDGTGDNGSGISLALTVAARLNELKKVPHTVVFVFFTAEEYGCYGSTAYANAMSEEEIANTLYMINMDSLICGDYCYLYGGVQDDETLTVTQTEAYDNAIEVAKSLGIEFKSNPWTVANPAPGYDTPDYISPTTGDWSDHVGFKNKGIPYLYFEATNWEIPGPYDEYDGYGETEKVGMIMNTERDYLEFIETNFPGRPKEHINKFFTLLNALLTQQKLPWE